LLSCARARSGKFADIIDSAVAAFHWQQQRHIAFAVIPADDRDYARPASLKQGTQAAALAFA
jgi:hypothetical protein